MNIPHSLAKAARIWAGVGLIVCLVAGCKPAPPPAAAKPLVTAVKTNSLPVGARRRLQKLTFQFLRICRRRRPETLFIQTPTGVNRRLPPLVVVAAKKAALASDLLLKGIVGSATHRLAVINNRDFGSRRGVSRACA